MLSKFIKASNEYTTLKKSIPAPMIRKNFELNFTPKTAKIFITTPGFYELYINGKNITKGFLAPYISNPNQMLCYDEYDITSLLCKGKNAVGIILGNGFMNQTISHWFFNELSFSGPVCVALDLHADGDGESFSLSADESFKVHPSPILYDIYRSGVRYDARLEIDGWCNADFDDSDWDNAKYARAPLGELVPCYAHPILTRAELKPISIERQQNFCYYYTHLYKGEPVEITRVKDGYMYDFGINTSGVCRLKIKGERGQKITLRHGERLAADGKFCINSAFFPVIDLPDYEDHVKDFQTEVYTLKGGKEEIFVPPFTYHGFRYVFVEGITEEQATKDLLTYIVFSSDVKKRADFKCSNSLINQLYDMTVNADLSNFHYVLTDDPHREKNGWTGDIAVSAEQVFLTFDCADSFKLWMRSMRYTQTPEGMLPGVVPTEKYGYKWGNGPMWDSVAIQLPFSAYKYDGRLDLFEENSEMLDKYIHYIANRRDSRGLIACGLGDWCQPGFASGIPIKAPLELTDTVTTYDIAKKAKMLFLNIGETKRAEYADGLAKELKASIREHLIDYESMTASGSCQTSQAYLLAMNIFTADEYERAYARLIDIINQGGRKIDTGMIGTRHIFEVLALGGDIDLAIELMLNDDGPSYKNMINRGATALCEAFEDFTRNSSCNHHFFGDIIRVFTNYVAGIRPNPNLNDTNEILFSPILPTNMEYANAEYKGVKAGWRRNGEKTRFYIDMPDDFHGKFVFGSVCDELKAGYNEFDI